MSKAILYVLSTLAIIVIVGCSTSYQYPATISTDEGDAIRAEARQAHFDNFMNEVRANGEPRIHTYTIDRPANPYLPTTINGW